MMQRTWVYTYIDWLVGVYGGAWCLFSGWQWSRMGKSPGSPPLALLDLAFVPRQVAGETYSIHDSINNDRRAGGWGLTGCLHEERGNGAVRTTFQSLQSNKQNEVVTPSRDPPTITADIRNLFPVEFCSTTYSFLAFWFISLLFSLPLLRCLYINTNQFGPSLLSHHYQLIGYPVLVFGFVFFL